MKNPPRAAAVARCGGCTVNTQTGEYETPHAVYVEWRDPKLQKKQDEERAAVAAAARKDYGDEPLPRRVAAA